MAHHSWYFVRELIRCSSSGRVTTSSVLSVGPDIPASHPRRRRVSGDQITLPPFAEPFPDFFVGSSELEALDCGNGLCIPEPTKPLIAIRGLLGSVREHFQQPRIRLRSSDAGRSDAAKAYRSLSLNLQFALACCHRQRFHHLRIVVAPQSIGCGFAPRPTLVVQSARQAAQRAA